MKTIPKPKYCGQDWLEMKPNGDKKLCGHCQKNIVDFSEMKWSEIEKIQRDNDNSVCGMYSDKQLTYWGQEIPLSTNKALLTTAFLIGLSTNTLAQTDIEKKNKEKIYIQGYITSKTKTGRVDTIVGTTVLLKNTTIATVANDNGFYKLDISGYTDTTKEPVIIFSTIGYYDLEVKLDNNLLKGEVNQNIQLAEDESATIAFYVRKPTLGQKIKRKFRKWFGRKE